jgi:uncharacterized protein YcnI
MKHSFAIHLIAACALSAGAGGAFSHIVLQDGAAVAGASYRATFRVGHGCDGAATTGIKVSIPVGFNGAQPMPKAGWTVRAVTDKLAQAYEAHGKTFTEGVAEISWTANSAADALPSDFYDEFVLRGTTPTKPGPLWFKVVQTCTQGSTAWVDVPLQGTSTKGLKSPAALLEVLLDTQAAGGHNH